jgi:hypothetical protein
MNFDGNSYCFGNRTIIKPIFVDFQTGERNYQKNDQCEGTHTATSFFENYCENKELIKEYRNRF